jgi:hydroxyacylglutathione hydrolase
MNMEIIAFTLGPVQTNTYLVADGETKEAVVIDPAWDGGVILQEAYSRDWRIGSIWLTHAHFDHLGGAAAVADGTDPPPPVALHPEDYWLWRQRGNAPLFGLEIDPGPEPTVDLAHEQRLFLGDLEFEVRHAPGHTPGHVMFYEAGHAVLFGGDVIFQNGVGRTDLPGGNTEQLFASIRTQVLTLPDKTRVLSGHGPETSVGIERAFLSQLEQIR